MKKLVLIACSLLAAYGTKAQDAGVNAISAPTSPVLAGVSKPVSVTVKNYGNTALTSATLGFSVNGVVQPTFPWSGNLATNGISAAVNIGNFTFPAGNHTVKAWSKLPNGVTDLNAANDTTTINIFACSSLSGNYSINNNAAATATNFTSVTAAAQALALCGVSGPVTFTVAPNSGPYPGVVNLPVISGTSAINTVTFEGNGNTISGAGSQGLITFIGADFVKINNFRLNVDPTSTTSSGVYFSNVSDNNTISNCTINLSVGSTSMSVSGIAAGNFGGDNVNNLLLQNNVINGGHNGIFLSGTATTTGNQIIGNIVRDPRAYGILIHNGGSGTLIEGNDISRPTRVNTQSLYGITLQGNTINTIVNKNRIHNTHDMASSTLSIVRGIHTSAAAPAGSENIIKNNLIYNINNNGGPLNALANEGGSGTYYYHNTISADNPNIIYTEVRGLYFQAPASNVKFINNIVSLTSLSGTSYGIYIGSPSVALVSNYNDLFVGSSGHIGYLSTNFSSLAQWQAANNNAYDQNSLSVDPVFATTTYLQPLAAALNNAGMPLPAVTDAINGGTRSAISPDIGAYEFAPAVNDASVTAINAPTTPVSPGSQPVTVTLKNFGTANIASATIGWSVNNVAQTPYAWSGSLSSLQATATPVAIGNYAFTTGNHVLKVWSQNPNGVADDLIANDTTILNLVSCAPLAGNYTINKNNPTAGTNYQSFAAVVQKLTSCGVSGPVTITVVPGTGPYNEQVEITNIPYTSATNTVTFEGSGNTVSVTPAGKLGIFVLNGAKFVKLNNFVITAPAGVTSVMGVQLHNFADNNTISNNTINLPVTGSVANVSGIAAGADLFSKGNNTSYTKIQNNIINGGGTGIKILGNTGGLNAINNQITGNQVRDSYYTGISINEANGTLVEGNDISRPTLTASGNFTAIEMLATTQNSIISKNRIHNTHDQIPATTSNVIGIQINTLATIGLPNIVKNNLIYNIKSTGCNFIGLHMATGSGAYFDNNTVATDPGASFTSAYGMYFSSGSTNMKFRNNIIYLPSTVATLKYALYLVNINIALESNNNDLFIGAFGSGSVGYFNNTPYYTVATWKTANNNAYDQNSVSIDPAFVNLPAGDLTPTAPALDNLGQPIANITDDIQGVSRNIATPDMGAYEFVSIGNDVGIVAVTGPSITGCGLSSAESVTVTIKNFGTTTQTSIPVSYKVNGVAIAAPETFTGSISSNATATYTFNTKANLAAAGNYQIIATTQLAGDNIANNDPDTLNVTNTLLPALPVAFNFETTASGIAGMRKVVNAKSAITEGAGASNGTGSTKGMIMDGVDHAGWVAPTGTTDPWTSNPDNFAAAYLCISPGNGAATDSLILTFDLKQLFKTAIENTNFRVTVNGVQVGSTYRPALSGTGTWQNVRVNLTQYKNAPTIQIGLESSVKEAYANGNGTANLIDNIGILRVAGPTGVKDNLLQSLVNVYPNPSNGLFNIDLPKGKNYALTVTDLSGKVIRNQTISAKNNVLDMTRVAKGIYLLKIQSAAENVVRKLVIE